MPKGRERRTLSGHSAEVDGVALSLNGMMAASTSQDRTLRVWSLTLGIQVRMFQDWETEIDSVPRTIRGREDYVQGVAFSADGRLAVSALIYSSLKVWDVLANQKLLTLNGHSGWIKGVALSADGRLAISASNDKTLVIWEMERPQIANSHRA